MTRVADVNASGVNAVPVENRALATNNWISV